MIDGLKPYPAYKESGVPWLGEVPACWHVASLRHRYSQCLGKMLDAKRIKGEHPLPYLRNVDVQWDRINIYNIHIMDISPDEYERFALQPGDLLVCEGGEVGRAATWTGELPICGYQKALHRLRPHNPKDDLPRFLYYLLRVASGLGAFADGHESTIPHLTGEKLRAHRFPFPSLIEQAAIVRFLDHADRLIRRYILAKKKLIALLTEQKQAIIHQAITRGLDPNVKLKPSGVEWLGDVPEHWEVKRAKCFYREVDERSTTGSEELMSVSHKTGVTSRKQSVTMFLAASNIGHKICRPGDIVINTMWAFMAALGVARKLGVVSPSYGVYRPHVPNIIISNYVDLLIRTPAYKAEYHRRSTGITSSRLRLYPDSFLRIPLLRPPVSDQEAIVKYLEFATADIQTALDQTQREIDLLQEYRTRLIADVVTGKLDVREAAARLPDEAEGPEAIDETEDFADLDEDIEGEDMEDAFVETEA